MINKCNYNNYRRNQNGHGTTVIFMWFTLYLLAASLPAASSEAATCPDDCGPHGECVEEDETWSCRCNDPYTGPDCSIIRSDLDPCLPNPCLPGECQEVPGATAGFQCICPKTRKGQFCETIISECTSNLCQHNAINEVSQDTVDDSWMLVAVAIILTFLGLALVGLVAAIAVTHTQHDPLESWEQNVVGFGWNNAGCIVLRDKSSKISMVKSTNCSEKKISVMASIKNEQRSETELALENVKVKFETDTEFLPQAQTSKASEDINIPSAQDTYENPMDKPTHEDIKVSGNPEDTRHIDSNHIHLHHDNPLHFGSKHLHLHTLALGSIWTHTKAKQQHAPSDDPAKKYPRNEQPSRTETPETSDNASPKMSPFKTKRRSVKTHRKKYSNTIYIDDDEKIF